MSNKQAPQDRESTLLRVIEEHYGKESRSLDQIYRERAEEQRDAIFDLLRSLYVCFVRECHAENNQHVMEEYSSSELKESLPKLSTINDLVNNSLSDKDAWLPFITEHTMWKWYEKITDEHEVIDTSNDFMSFINNPTAIITDDWTAESVLKNPMCYGFGIFIILETLLSIDRWGKGIYALLTKVDQCALTFFYSSGADIAILKREFISEENKIVERNKIRIANTKRSNSLAVTIDERHQGLLEFIKNEASKGKFLDLKQSKVTTLAKKITFHVGIHNYNIEKKENAISPADDQGIKSILIKKFGFSTSKSLPKNYIDILISGKP